VTVVAIVLIGLVLIPVLALVLDIVAAVGIGVVLIVVALIAFFIWLRTRLVGDE
jgi:hypothetical protein